MKKIMLTLVLSLSGLSYAHDEGHGPKVADAAKYGGIVSGIVLEADAKKGAEAALVHKAELVRSTDGTVRLYLYNAKMESLNLKEFAPKATATLAAKVKGKWKDVEFPLELKDNSFSGKMPKPAAKPYNIDVVLTEKSKKLLTAFDNLD